ncbi:MAG: ATP-binding cassette domain-containing protein [Bacilli bacterium]
MKIEVNNLKKDFKNINILHDVNIKFSEGKIYGIIGRNGSGKSVFLKMLCAFYQPTSGEILFDGENIIKNKKFPPSTRALIEKPSFLNDLTGFENLKMLAEIQNQISDKEILASCENVNLGNDIDKKFALYSLGMKQKLGIAQVIMEDPKIMIFDEPFNGIENKTAEKLRKYLIDIKKDKIIIIASHIKEDIQDMADVVFEFDDGTIKKVS